MLTCYKFKGDIPIFFKSASGNQVDSKCLGSIAVDYKKQIQVDSLIVADCALYTESNIKLKPYLLVPDYGKQLTEKKLLLHFIFSLILLKTVE